MTLIALSNTDLSLSMNCFSRSSNLIKPATLSSASKPLSPFNNLFSFKLSNSSWVLILSVYASLSKLFKASSLNFAKSFTEVTNPLAPDLRNFDASLANTSSPYELNTTKIGILTFSRMEFSTTSTFSSSP
ncbi:hypothetical protein PanWU01x14_189740, partial [Parasponia andersonii]